MQLYNLRRYRISTLETKERFFQSLYNILSSIFSMKDRRSHQAWITLRGRCHAPPDTFYTDQILHQKNCSFLTFSFLVHWISFEFGRTENDSWTEKSNTMVMKKEWTKETRRRKIIINEKGSRANEREKRESKRRSDERLLEEKERGGQWNVQNKRPINQKEKKTKSRQKRKSKLKESADKEREGRWNGQMITRPR